MKWCAVDAEGDAGERGLQGVAFYSDRYSGYCTDTDDITRVLFDHASDGYTFLCHNASYDIPVVWGQLDLKPELVYYNDRLHHGQWRYDKRKKLAHIWDTLDLSGGMSLARLGESLGLPKYPTPQRLQGKDPDKYQWRCSTHNIWECEECYAIRDAEIAYTFMVGLETQLSAWGITPQPRLAGTALEVWKQLDKPESIDIQSYKIRQLARKAYYGGRCETFKIGHIRPLYTADVTSMYPSIMGNIPYPDPQSLCLLENIRSSSLPLDYEGVATVDITIPPMHVPPLPYTVRGERVYPIGRLVGTWTLLELRYAISLGCRINDVRQCVYATDSIFPFPNFIGVLWAMREEYKKSNDPRSLFAKLMLNNLYGRLGTNEGSERRILKEVPDRWDSREHSGYEYRRVGERMYCYRTDTLSLNGQWCNVMWAAQTTSGARIKLHQFLIQQGDELVYCDTDSVFSTKSIVGTGKGLGQLETTGEYQAAIIAQPKLYAFQDFNGEWYAKAKGVPREFALKFLHGEEVRFQKPVKPTESINRGLTAGEWVWSKRKRYPVDHRRHPIHPEALYNEYGMSDTVPPVNGPIV